MTQETPNNTQTTANVTGSVQPKVASANTKPGNPTVQVKSATFTKSTQSAAQKTPQNTAESANTNSVGGLFASSNRIISNTANKANKTSAATSNKTSSNQDVTKQPDNKAEKPQGSDEKVTKVTNEDNRDTKNNSKEDTKTTEASQAKPVVTKTVNIVITGVTYPINCPEDEEDGLNAAAAYINNFIGDIRKEAPTLTHENLLVLTCLNLYERISQFEASEKTQKMQDQRVRTLLNKITKDAKSVLPQTP